MNEAMIPPALADAFCEEVFSHAFATAGANNIGDALATVLLLEQLIADCAMVSPLLLRAYFDATLAEMETAPDSAAEAEAIRHRHSTSEALVMALAKALDIDLFVETLPGGDAGRLN